MTFDDFWKNEILGTDVGRTRDLRFTRATPYHLATAPFAIEKKVPSQQAIVPICDYERANKAFLTYAYYRHHHFYLFSQVSHGAVAKW